MECKVHVRDLERHCLIGIDPHEQGRPQRVRFNVDITLAGTTLPETLEQSVPYDAIVRHIEALSQTHIDLAETYVARIAAYCLAFPATAAVTVCLDKLEAFPAAAVGASVTVRRNTSPA
jgi:dihydroneopterin aldolase